MALAVSISDRNSDAEPARPLADQRQEVDLEVGLDERLQAAELLNVLRAFGDYGIDHVINRDDAEHMSVLGDDRHGEEVVFREQPRDLLPICHWRNRNGVIGPCNCQNDRLGITSD